MVRNMSKKLQQLNPEFRCVNTGRKVIGPFEMCEQGYKQRDISDDLTLVSDKSCTVNQRLAFDARYEMADDDGEKRGPT